MGLQVRALGRREPTMGLVWIIHLQFAFAIMDVHTAQLAHVCFQEAALNWIHGPEASHTWYWAVPTVPRTPNAGSSGQDVLPPKKKKRWLSLSLEHTKNTSFFLVSVYQEHFRFLSGIVNQAAMTSWLASCGRLVTNVCLPPWLVICQQPWETTGNQTCARRKLCL